MSVESAVTNNILKKVERLPRGDVSPRERSYLAILLERNAEYSLAERLERIESIEDLRQDERKRIAALLNRRQKIILYKQTIPSPVAYERPRFLDEAYDERGFPYDIGEDDEDDEDDNKDDTETEDALPSAD